MKEYWFETSVRVFHATAAIITIIMVMASIYLYRFRALGMDQRVKEVTSNSSTRTVFVVDAMAIMLDVRYTL